METRKYIAELNRQLSHLYSFARQMNELDFAASLGGEFRGAQDAGWSTLITANEVFEELSALAAKKELYSVAEYRTVLMLYCQLSEAGGMYESLKNIMGVVKLKPYLLWPFNELVRVRKAPPRVIGPNANATFRDLAADARAIGMSRLAELLDFAFRDDIRNGIAHADYVIWNGELRLRKRNGGNAGKLSIEEVNAAITRGMGFFQILREYNIASAVSFNPAKEIIGRFSANSPMPWTVFWDPDTGGFSISGSAPAPVSDERYERQERINARLGGKILASFLIEGDLQAEAALARIQEKGFEPNIGVSSAEHFEAVLDDLERFGLPTAATPRLSRQPSK